MGLKENAGIVNIIYENSIFLPLGEWHSYCNFSSMPDFALRPSRPSALDDKTMISPEENRVIYPFRPSRSYEETETRRNSSS